MKILFVLRQPIYVRNFSSTLEQLAQHGHSIHVVFDMRKREEVAGLGFEAIEQLAQTYSSITYALGPPRDHDDWVQLGRRVRASLDFFRYLQPEYDAAPKLRRRAARNAPPGAARLARVRHIPLGTAGLRLAFGVVERALPRSRDVDTLLSDYKPDLVVISPLVEPGSPQAEFVRSARALGIRTALCVYSWDNLTNKGLIHETPDLVTVWNAAMRREAVELHGVPPERVVVTGAPAYDQWFDWAPSTTRDEFCQRVGLPTDQPLLLYVCSSKFIAPDEVPFVRHWLQQLRAHPDACLRSVGVLIRPHPQNAAQWRTADLADLGPAVVWPLDGANPVDASAKADYFDSIFHAAAVIGVNTSALIESAIVGRPVHTLLAPEFRETQEGTLHFHHLVREAGGMLRVAATFDEHAAQLQQALADATTPHASALNAAFLEAFVRPYGLHEPATPRLVAAIEALAAQPAPAPTRDPLWAPPVRFAIGLVFRPKPARTQKATRPSKADARRKKVPASISEPNYAAAAANGGFSQVSYVAPAFGPRDVKTVHYVREQIEAMARAASSDSAYTMAVRMPHLRSVIASSRPHGAALHRFWETLVKPASAKPDYTDVAIHRAVADRLLEAAPAHRRLMVPDPPVLGADGVSVGDKLFTLDGLTLYENLLALQLGGVLDELGHASERPVVWIVGADLGRLVYQLKVLYPNTMFIVSDPPELLLFSAAYLLASLPHTRARFVLPDVSTCTIDDAFDYTFMAPSVLPEIDYGRLCLTVRVPTLYQPTTGDLERITHHAHAIGSSYIYSMLDLANDQAGQLTPANIDWAYWIHSVPGFTMRKQARRNGTAAGNNHQLKSDNASARARQHIVGWRRLKVS